MDKTRLKRWGEDALQKLNGASGVLAIAGIIISFASAKLLPGQVSMITTTIAILITVSLLVYTLWTSFPPPIREATNLIGEAVKLEELQYITPKVQKLAIIGPSRTGKSTLKKCLNFDSSPDKRTQDTTATITPICSNPITPIAILDGGGERLTQQFKIAEEADYLFVVVDHNISDEETSLCEQRLQEAKYFMEQVRGHLKETKCSAKVWVELIANKRDLWEQLDDKNKQTFIKFMNDEVTEWQKDQIGTDVRYAVHSKNMREDINRVSDVLVNSVSG